MCHLLIISTTIHLFCTLYLHKFKLEDGRAGYKRQETVQPKVKVCLWTENEQIKSMAHAWSEQSMNTNAVLEGIREKLIRAV